jgi:hypothetical protein
MARRCCMGTSARDRLGRLLDGAERADTCLVPPTRKDARLAERMAGEGILLRPSAGMFVRATVWRELPPDTRQLWVMRALQAKHPDWTFCGVSAALAYGITVSYRDLHEVWVAAKANGRVRHTASMRQMVTDTSAAKVVGGIRVTSIERTLLDCARTVSFADGLAIVDCALRARLVTRERLLDYVLDMDERRVRAGRAYVVFLHADRRAESGGESMARAAMLALGFQEPELQVPVRDPVDGRTYRLDFCWRLSDGSIVGGEFDGREKYESAEMLAGNDTLGALMDERQRESRVTAGGIRILRFSYGQMRSRDYFERLLLSYGIPRGRLQRGIVSDCAAASLLAEARRRRAEQRGEGLLAVGPRGRMAIDGTEVAFEVVRSGIRAA